MSGDAIKVVINGAGGRMGRRLVAMVGDDERFELVSAVEQSGLGIIGTTVGGVKLTDRFTRGGDVLIDFSASGGTQGAVAAAMNDKTAMVIGTTGLERPVQMSVEQAAEEIAIVQSANFSVGVNVLFKLVGQAATILGDAYDVEIVETHHRFKADAPSGTALALAECICRATGKNLDEAARHGRHGQGERVAGEIGMHAIRLGDTVGEHAVHFGTLGETVTLSHSAHTRDNFASGALRAAAWVANKPPGIYDMNDVLFGQG